MKKDLSWPRVSVVRWFSSPVSLLLLASGLLAIVGMTALTAPQSVSAVNRQDVRAAAAEAPSLAQLNIVLSQPGPILSGSVGITATVTGAATARKAVLYLDGIERAVSSGNPFDWDWVTPLVANGEHQINIEALAETGDLVASGSITATVNNSATPRLWMAAGLSGQYVYDLETVPGEQGIAYAVLDKAVYKTADWGCFWGSMKQGLPAGSGPDRLSVSASDPATVVLGTRTGVYVSHDGGTTWQPTALGQGAVDVSTSGTDGQWMYAITESNTLYRSSDGGNSWAAMLQDAGRLCAISVDPADGRIAYVGTGYPWTPAELFRTSDGGDNWASVRIAEQGEVCTISSIHPPDRQTLYLGLRWGPGGLYKSTDGGASWQSILPFGVDGLARAPSDPQTLYVGEQWGTQLVRSEDGGQQWQDFKDGFPPDASTTWLAVDGASPAVVYGSASTGGVWSTVYTAVNPEPLVSDVWPRAAYNDRQVTITITGTGFCPTPQVMLNSIPLLDVTVISSNTVTATVPAGQPAGVYDLSVVNPSGQRGYLPSCFALTTLPEIEITEPSNFAVVSGTVTVRAVAGEGNQLQTVGLYLDETLHASAVISPYTWIWNSSLSSDGAHRLKAVAYDRVGGTAASPPVELSVDNPAQHAGWSHWLLAGATVRDLESDQEADLLWALSEDALYKSSDQGMIWVRADTGLPEEIQLFASSDAPISTRLTFAARWNQVFVSSDAGNTWTLDKEFLQDLTYLGFAEDTPYAATWGYQVYTRRATGEWKTVGNQLDAFVNVVALHQSTLYVGTSAGLYRLDGTAWVPVVVDPYPMVQYRPSTWFEPGLKMRPRAAPETTPLSIDVQSIAVLDGTVYLGTNGGRAVYRSDDGVSWTACDVGLTSHSVRKLSRATNGWLLAATTDGVFLSQDRGDRWQAMDAGLPHSVSGYNVLLDSVTATSLATANQANGLPVLAGVFNDVGVRGLATRSDMLLHRLPPSSPPKAVLIVGPVDPPDHAGTRSFIAWADRLADIMQQNGLQVVKVYWPNSTWDNVRAALTGASIVVYKGHGFGLGDVPQDATEMVGGCNGFCLVDPADPAGARLGTQDMLIATGQLADNAIVFFFCCYCGGSSASDETPVSEELARRRIEAYAFTSLRLGARAYFASVSEEEILTDLFAHPSKTVGAAYKSAGGEPEHSYSHVVLPQYSVWFDGSTSDGWGRAFVGDPDLTLSQALHRQVYLPIVIRH